MKVRAGAREFRVQELRPKFGFCLIDLQFETGDRRVRWMTGSLNEGIEALVKFVEFLKEAKIPIGLIEIETASSPTNTRLVEVAGNGVTTIKKKSVDAFENPQMDAFLEHNKVDTMIVAGFHPLVCVKQTALSGLARKYEVWTSRQLLFTSEIGDSGFGRTMHEAHQLKFYRDTTSYFETLDELERKIRSLIS